MNFSNIRSTANHGMQAISVFPDDCYSEIKSLLFKFKSNRLTTRRGTIPSFIFDIFYQPVIDNPTLHDISIMKSDYPHLSMCKHYHYIHRNINPFPNTIWEDNTTFGDFSRRMAARYKSW